MSFFVAPTATTTAPSTIPITTTTVTAKPVTRTFRDLERLLTKWQTDFDTKHRLSYENLSQSVRQRDVDLSTYRETLQLVQRDINQMQLQQSHLQDELKLLESHEKELELNLQSLESDIMQLPPLQQDIYSIQQNVYLGSHLPVTFNERMKNFQLMEQLDSLVKCSTKDLQEIVDKMNEQDDDHDQEQDLSTTSQPVDPMLANEQNIKQLTKTLDSCFKMLAFVDTNVADIENKVTQTTQRLLNS